MKDKGVLILAALLLLTIGAGACATASRGMTVPAAPLVAQTSPAPAMDNDWLQFDLALCTDAVANNYCDGPSVALIVLTPVGVGNPSRMQMGDANGYAWFANVPRTWQTLQVDITADGFAPYRLVVPTQALVDANAAGRHNFITLQK